MRVVILSNVIFSVVPFEVFIDDRLSIIDLRVIGILLAYRNSLSLPDIDWISTDLGLESSIVVRSCLHIKKLGWFEKIGINADEVDLLVKS